MTTPQTGMAADDKLTTIKVPTSVRDRIKARADRFGFPTLAAYLDALIDRAEWDEAWEEQRAIVAKMTPADWADYDNEMKLWDSALNDGLANEPAYPQD